MIAAVVTIFSEGLVFIRAFTGLSGQATQLVYGALRSELASESHRAMPCHLSQRSYMFVQ